MLPEYSYQEYTSGKWIANIPFKQIYSDLSTPYVAFNLQKLTLPDFAMKTAEFSIKGDNFPVPTHTRPMSKTANFTFLLSSNWHQYSVLYRWFNNIASIESTPTTEKSGWFLDIDIVILSEFKKPMFSIILEKSFITKLGKVSLDYVEGSSIVPINFEIAFQFMKFDYRFPNHELNNG